MHGASLHAAGPSWFELWLTTEPKMEVWNQKNRTEPGPPLKIAEGHRPGNFRPSPETVTAIQRVMQFAETGYVIKKESISRSAR